MESKMITPTTSSTKYGVDDAHELEALLARIAKEDKAALGELYERTKAAIYGFALSMSHSPADAEDVLQDTYIAVYSAAANYVSRGKPMAWLMTIAKNLAKMRLRAVKKHLDIAEEDWGRYLTSVPDVSADERMLLQVAMKVLSDEQQQIVMLHAVAGMKHREIARLLDMPTATVLSKYSRAIKKLRIAMEAE